MFSQVKQRPTQEGVRLLIKLARFRKECRKLNKLEPLHYPAFIRDAAKKQGIIIK